MKEQKFSWISKVIDSCTDTFHFEGVQRLIDLFYEQEKDDDLKLELEALSRVKYKSVHAIID